MLCLEEQYAKISILWNTPLPVRIAAKRFRWCWTYPCTSKLMWKIAKCAATPLRSVTPCRTKSWWNFRHGLWDDRRLKCQRILQRNPVIRPAVDHAIMWEGSGLHSSTIDLLLFVPSDTSRSFAALPDRGCLCPQRIDGEKMQNTLTSVFGFLVLFTSAHNRSGPANKSSGHREQDLPTP
jgi:hypothetical protein